MINKFFDTEARINCLLDILSTLEFEKDQLSDKSKELIKKWEKAQREEEEEEA